MTETAPARDLVILAADRSIEATVRGLLNRPESLGIRRVSHDTFVHPYRDPSCRKDSHGFLKPFVTLYNHALVIFDREGCGKESSSSDELEQEVAAHLAANGWNSRAAVIVLDPELEAWVWSDSPHVSDVIQWQGGRSSLNEWLISQGFLRRGETKPVSPKEAFESALRHTRTPRSSSLYHQLAGRVSFERCQDASFLRFRRLMLSWFAA